ncbi:MAG: BMP family ABC transporter substrate-binding protein [Bifidobacteriaceae bacterium]|jgi:basic membrane protein A|nr:BMP family ABC transporter substrate-binding protein [Bifidobacteriaceae bacterium]
MKKVGKSLVAACSVLLLVLGGLTACSNNPSSDDSASSFLACAVSGAGGFQDKSFNQATLEGLQEAASKFSIEIKTAESQTESDYTPNLEAMVSAGCNVIFPAGYNLVEATNLIAREKPDSHYAMIDDDSIDLPNVKPVIFDTAQASFLAGYVAAGYSKTHIIGTIGGDPQAAVQLFMDGYQQGAIQYDKDNGTETKVVGWDTAKPDGGQFIGSYTDQTKCRTIAEAQIAQGADVIMPVAAAAGLGAAAAAKSAGDVSVVWVDADGALAEEGYADIFLTSVMKNIQTAVVETVDSMLTEETFSNKAFIGTLENGGVGIAPYHSFESKLSDDLKSKVETIKADIIAGTLVIESQFAPNTL